MFQKFQASKRILTVLLVFSLLLTFSAAGLCSVSAEEESAAPVYTLFGEELPFTLAENGAATGLKLSDETLSGAPVVESIGDEFYTVQLNPDGTSYKNVKLSYKFKEPSLTGKAAHKSELVNVWGPVFAELSKTETDSYRFGQSYWAPNDITFSGHGEAQRRNQFGGKGAEEWHAVEFTIYENQVSILLDGICWYNGELKDTAPEGDVALVFGYAGTKVADVAVTESTARDVAEVVNVDYSKDAYSDFPLTSKGTYDAAEQAFVFNLAWEDENVPYYFGNVSDWTVDPDACRLKDYEIEMEVNFIKADWNHGVVVLLPSGEKIGIQLTRIYNYVTGGLYSSTSVGEAGVYKKVKIVCKDDFLTISVAGQVVYSAAVDYNREAGVIRFGRYGNSTEQIAIRGLKITDISGEFLREDIKSVNLDSFADGTTLDHHWSGAWSTGTYTANTVAGKKAATLTGAGSNGNVWFRNTADYADNRSFHMSFYIDSAVQADSENVLLQCSFSGGGLQIYIYKTQMRVTGSAGITAANGKTESWYSYANFGEGYSPYDRWIDLEVIFAGSHVILNYDGRQFAYTVSGAFSADTSTIDQAVTWSDATRLGLISFADIGYERVDLLSNAMAAIDGIGEVAATAESAALINTAYGLYERLHSIEKGNAANSGVYASAVKNYKALSGGADANIDGCTDIRDLVSLKKVEAGAKEQNFMCDLDEDGALSAADLAVVRKTLLS